MFRRCFLYMEMSYYFPSFWKSKQVLENIKKVRKSSKIFTSQMIHNKILIIRIWEIHIIRIINILGWNIFKCHSNPYS